MWMEDKRLATTLYRKMNRREVCLSVCETRAIHSAAS
jgi:hypothetical protein